MGGRQRGSISSKALRADEGGAAASTLKQRPQKENKRKEPQNKPGADDLRPLRSSLPRGTVHQNMFCNTNLTRTKQN